MGDIDFSKGGYEGDVIEMMFKSFTSQYMEYWWQFREVLISAQRKDHHFWMRVDGNPLSDDELRELIGLSLLNYAVYVGIAEAIDFQLELQRHVVHAHPLLVRRNWKALYSSVYSSFNALCNVVDFVIFNTVPAVEANGVLKNRTPGRVIGQLGADMRFTTIHAALKNVEGKLEIRHHQDHYWPLWIYLSFGEFRFDPSFKKGTVPLDPANEVQYTADALAQTNNDIIEIAQNYDVIYKELAKSGGYLDHYLNTRGWFVDYTLKGQVPNRTRPLP